jgi:E3 ubiquitin-protein ligase UBR7
MDRVQAIEGVRMYSQLRDDLMDFLKPYAESKNVVSEEDIRAFFVVRLFL